jgi:hypothetical protein
LTTEHREHETCDRTFLLKRDVKGSEMIATLTRPTARDFDATSRLVEVRQAVIAKVGEGASAEHLAADGVQMVRRARP